MIKQAIHLFFNSTSTVDGKIVWNNGTHSNYYDDYMDVDLNSDGI